MRSLRCPGNYLRGFLPCGSIFFTVHFLPNQVIDENEDDEEEEFHEDNLDAAIQEGKDSMWDHTKLVGTTFVFAGSKLPLKIQT